MFLNERSRAPKRAPSSSSVASYSRCGSCIHMRPARESTPAAGAGLDGARVIHEHVTARRLDINRRIATEIREHRRRARIDRFTIRAHEAAMGIRSTTGWLHRFVS